jgi:protein-disulfide isomerase
MKQTKSSMSMQKSQTSAMAEALKRAPTTSSSSAFSSMRSMVGDVSVQSILRLVMANFSTGLLIVASFLIGMLWTEVRYLKNGGAATAATTGTTTTTTQAAQQAVTLTQDQVKKLFTKGRIMFGDANRKLLFVEVSDPSCPFCHIAGGKDPELNKQSGGQFLLKADGGTYIAPVPEMKKLVDEGKASFLWLYAPGHGSGEMGTKAMYCAFDKGKFWQVHDLLMSNAGYNLLNNTVKNDKAQVDTLAEFLKSAMNPADLKDCITSGKYDGRLAEEYAVAQSIGYQGTPYFLVNTKQFPGAFSYEQMQADVTAALK